MRFGLHWTICLCAFSATVFISTTARAGLADGLVSYWPLNEAQGSKTPDLVSGYDMTLNNLSAADLVGGKAGKCFSFKNTQQTLLSRIHGPNDDLPANKHAAFTVSFWANLTGTGQNDLRLFSEGFSPNNNNPLFNIGTHNGGSGGQVDLFFRQSGWTDVNHIKTTAEPLDGTWHMITFVQQLDGSRKIYIDAVADELEIEAKPEGVWLLNNTTIGGILRASGSHWVTGLIDEVAIWKRALTQAEIAQVKSEGLVSVFPPEAEGLVAHWPMEEIVGGKTPDLVSGYDMTANNLTSSDLVAGKNGKCFSFNNTKQSLLSRVHGSNDDLPANKNAAFTVAFWANVTGTSQNDLRLFSEGFTPNNNNPLFNIGTHNGGANGQADLYIRQTGWTDVNHIKTTAEPFDGTWHHLTFTQQGDGSRKIYIDGVADELEIPAKPAGAWTLNNTTIGGILRASGSHWVTGLIDEVAIWKRALSEVEVKKIQTSGVPKAIAKKQPLEIKSFAADFSSVAANDKTMLRWEGSKDANYSINENVGDVSLQTVGGTGGKEVVITRSTTYTLTATRGTESISKSTTVKAFTGIAPGWHLLDNFNTFTPGSLFSQTKWLGAEGMITVLENNNNKAIGYDAGADLTALRLQSYTVTEGQKVTLSFRVYANPVGPEDAILPIAVHVGLTERSIRFNGDFVQNVGPYLRIDRVADGATIDLQARNGVRTGTYEGQFTDAIQPGSWYRLWINVENKPFNVTGGIQNGGDLYSAYIQKEGDATRTLLFENYLADRDAINIDPALGAPTPDLNYLFISTMGTGQPSNQLLLDDFYLYTSGYGSTAPVTGSLIEVPSTVLVSLSSGGTLGEVATLTNITQDSGAKIIRATLPADQSKPAYLLINPAVTILKVTIEGNQLVVRYQ